MNLGFDFRPIFNLQGIKLSLERMVARINLIWKREHNPLTGGHTAVTATSVTVAQTLRVGTYVGTQTLPANTPVFSVIPLTPGINPANVEQITGYSGGQIQFAADTSIGLNAPRVSMISPGVASVSVNTGFQAGVNTNGIVYLNTGQLAFPAAQNPSANANTLDDYEEGTWAPTNPFLAFAAAVGHYTKVGRLVHVEVVVVWPVTADANNATFTMPFVLGAGASGGAGGIAWNAAAITCFNMATIGSNVASILNLGGGPLTNAAMSGLGVRFNASYETD